MAGPVWRVERSEPFVCEECLREVERGFVEGTVEDARFHPDRRLCDSCYAEHHALILKDS